MALSSVAIEENKCTKSVKNNVYIEIDKNSKSNDDFILKNVAKRLKFFFSDANLRIDKYLRHKIIQQRSDGFISIENILRFNTIKKYTSDERVIAMAVKHHGCSKILKLSEDRKKIARRLPFTKSLMKDNDKLNLRISNIPIDETDDKIVCKVTMDDLRTIFEVYGQISLVRMSFSYQDVSKDKLITNRDSLKKHSSIPIGKALVEFEYLFDFQNAAADFCIDYHNGIAYISSSIPKKSLKIGSNSLSINTRHKLSDRKLGKECQRASGFDSRTKKDIEEAKTSGDNSDNNSNQTVGFKNICPHHWVPGCIISIEGLPYNCTREKISEAISSFIELNTDILVDYSHGLNFAHIRFKEKSLKIAKIVEKLLDGSAKIDGSTVRKAYILNGIEEEKYYNEFFTFKNKQKIIEGI